MTQFIQANQLSPVQGSAGQQSLVQDQGPTAGEALASSIQGIGSLIDTAGNIYGQNRAQSLVNEEIETIDRARAAAEDGRFVPGDSVPDSLRMDQKEWDMLSQAVQSGTMTQGKARLLAASRLRSRISEEPLFADRMRKAASGILGFNIESEGARQYFASFQQPEATEDQQRWAEAQKRGEVLGISPEKVYRQMYEVDHAETQKILAKKRQDEGLSTASEAFTEFNKANASTMFPTFLGTIKEIVNEQGSVKEEEIIPSIEQMKMAELNELSTVVWGDAPQNTLEFQRAQSQIEARYEGLKTLVKSVGYDKLLETALNRQTNERKLFIGENYRDIQVMNEVGGQAAVQAFFDIQSKSQNETQRRQMMEQYPIFARFAKANSFSDEDIANLLPRVTKKLHTKEPLTEEEDAVVGPAAAETHNNTDNEDTKTRVIQRLEELGKKTAAMSIVASRPPRNTSLANVKGAVSRYQRELPALVQDLGTKISQFAGQENRFGEPVVKYTIDNNGDVQVESNRPLSLPEGVLDDIRSTAAAINQYNKAHNNGWSQEFGEDHTTYIAKLQRNLNNTGFARYQSSFKDFVVSGNVNKAKEQYELMKKANPDAIRSDFDLLYDEIRRRRLEQGAE